MSKPFFFGGRIEDSAYFVGRELELKRIFDSIDRSNTGQTQHVSIVGQKRIGKSSLLYHLIKSYPKYLSNSEKYRFIYVDTGDPRCHTLSGLHNLIVKEFQMTPIPSKMTLSKFAEIINDFEAKSGILPVLCIDDFERLLFREVEFPIEMFEMWRSLGSSNKISFVVSTQHMLSEIMKVDKYTSPFFNIFHIIELHEFNPRDCQALFNKSSEIGVPFSKEECNQLLKIAGSYPANLQIAGSLLYAQKLNLRNGEKVNWGNLRKDYKQQIPYLQGAKTKSSFFNFLRHATFLIFVVAPRYIGRFLLDILGRHDSKDSSALITGWTVIVVIAAILDGWLIFVTS